MGVETSCISGHESAIESRDHRVSCSTSPIVVSISIQARQREVWFLSGKRNGDQIADAEYSI